MTSSFRIKNWAKFQHYKDRNPPWIKLHVEIFASADWVMLDDASRLVAVVCMVVAAKNDGVVPNDPAYIQRLAYLRKAPNLKPLIECGFLVKSLADASEGEQEQANVRPEKEAETEKEAESILSNSPFDGFWKVYPRREARGAAIKAFEKACLKSTPEAITAAASAYAAKRAGQDKQFTKLPATWLNQECWLDDGIAPAPPVDAAVATGARAAWDGKAAPLVEAIGEAKFAAWFGDASFEPGPPTARIAVRKPFQKQWIEQHYATDLNRLYGNFRVELAA